MSIEVKDVQMHVLNMRTRFPFKYGIASLVALPHLFVRVDAEIDGRRAVGVAADGLPPKWFTKNPEAPFESDLDEMLAVIGNATKLTEDSETSGSVYELWQHIYEGQSSWAASMAYPPLLWGFGVSLVERALIDAFCRAQETTFANAVREDGLGVNLGAIHPELGGTKAAEFLPADPLSDICVRHTVGLADPLTAADIQEEDRLTDGLPHSLEENIQTYGLTHLKIKLCGDADADRARLKQIAGLMSGRQCEFTLDGNEQYTELAPFRALWEAIRSDTELDAFLGGLIFVEQPLHRDVALSDEAQAVLSDWGDCPPMIIDESDGSLDSSRRALECGYVGTSHKNCKGIFKGVANACLMARRATETGIPHILSSEDLANVGPVALTQDLAVLATLGISHSERNGHHYFAGLSMFPDDVQSQIESHHGTLYRSEGAFPTLAVTDGRLDVSSVVMAPFGYAFDLDTTRYTPLDEWSADSLDL